MRTHFACPRSLPIAKNPPKSSQTVSAPSRPFLQNVKGLSKTSARQVHSNFAKNLGRRVLGNTFSGPKDSLLGPRDRPGGGLPRAPNGGVQKVRSLKSSFVLSL